jgi:hypothetical protein
MAKRIFKYKLPQPSGAQTIQMPQGAVILSVGMQRNFGVIWAIVDEDAPPVNRKFEVLLTGSTVPDATAVLGKFLGTLILGDGDFVLHVFDLGA